MITRQLPLTGLGLGDSRLPPRFWEKVKLGPAPGHRPDLGPCWLWTGGDSGNGYGRFRWQGRSLCAHRLAYETLLGLIPQGLESDHLCRVRACVNPSHIEPVTRSVNTLRGDHWERRKTHCPQAHPYDEENTYIDLRNKRVCRRCRSLRQRAV